MYCSWYRVSRTIKMNYTLLFKTYSRRSHKSFFFIIFKARGADVPEIPGDLSLKTCGSTASMKVKHVKK